MQAIARGEDSVGVLTDSGVSSTIREESRPLEAAGCMYVGHMLSGGTAANVGHGSIKSRW